MNFMTLVAAAAALTISGSPEPRSPEHMYLPALLQQGDAGESVWRDARRAIAEEDWDAAIQGFTKLRTSFPRSAYVGDSYYWQAWTLRQKGGTAALRQAISLLDTQRDKYGSAATVTSGEAKSLATRIRGLLARAGDEASAAMITKSAGQAASPGSSSGGAAVNTNPGAGDNSGSRRANVARAGQSVASENRTGRSGQSSGCKDENDDERVMALNALLQMNGEDALPILKQVLARRDACSEVLRRKAVFLVSQKRSADAADILVEAAQNDPDQETREQAVFWLSEVRSPRAITLLEQILKGTKDEAIQEKAIFSLQNTGNDRGMAALRAFADREDVSEHLREEAVFWIGQHRGDDNAQFLRGLFTRTKNSDLKDKIIFSISQTKQSGNGDFLLDQALNPANSIDIRKNALFWAGQSNVIDVAKLGELYDKSKDSEFREQVIFVLSEKSKSPAAVDKLIEIAKTEKNRDLREKAVFWLGQSRDPRAAKALQDLILKSPE